jgi:DDE superfamily endonuclease/Archaeal putative transposase ISC1217
MFVCPPAAEPLVQSIRHVFTRRTFDRFLTLMCGVIVTMGRRTVSRALRVMELHLQGHYCNYHRIYSQARYSMWKLALAVTRQVVALLHGDEPILLVVDDTVQQKNGQKVWAKGAHRDGRRSTRGHVSIKFGHKWLVMCILAKLPGMNRSWALPVLCGLCRPKKTADQTNQRPKSASQIALQLLMRMMRWFPDRRFILIGDSRAVSHRVACFAHRHRDRVTLISRLRSDANLYDPPQKRGTKKGRKKPSPRKQVQRLPHQTQTVAWYGSSRRQITQASDTALWHSVHGRAVVPIRWVCVLADPKLGMQEAYFYSTDQSMTAARIIELYALRWNIEVTFEESRALLGLETTRHWCRQSVLRVMPILLGLFTATALIWKGLSQEIGDAQPQHLSQTPCYRKETMTFADALYLVRRELWTKSLLQHHDSRRRNTSWLQSLPSGIRSTLIWHLAAAA